MMDGWESFNGGSMPNMGSPPFKEGDRVFNTYTGLKGYVVVKDGTLYVNYEIIPLAKITPENSSWLKKI